MTFQLKWLVFTDLFEKLRPKTPDITLLNAWGNGETGFPFVDACMRYLRKNRLDQLSNAGHVDVVCFLPPLVRLAKVR